VTGVIYMKLVMARDVHALGLLRTVIMLDNTVASRHDV
jgi:hypothetical protein